METKKLTESAILSSMLIAIGILCIGTGIGYSLYLDFIVPVMLVIIYIRCGCKLAVLSGLNTLWLMGIGLGQITASIWIAQSLLIGIVCGKLLTSRTTIIDDLLYGTLLGTLVMLIIDRFFAGVIGFSILDEIPGLMIDGLLSESLKKMAFYIGVVSLPVGTVLIVYIITLFVGHRLGVLKGISAYKYKILRNYKNYRGCLCCSQNTTIWAIVALIAIEQIIGCPMSTYIEAFFTCCQYILLYFMLMDAYTALTQMAYLLTRSNLIANSIGIFCLFALLTSFKKVAYGMMITNLVIDVVFRLRGEKLKQLEALVLQ